MRITYLDSQATAEATPLPGCPQAVVLHNAFVAPDLREQGIGTAAHADRLNVLRHHLYDLAICTVVENNHAQERILLRAGWTRVTRFFNRRTGNWVWLWTRPLAD